MDRFIEYINNTLPDKSDGRILYRFKKQTLDEMNQRALEVAGRGGIQNRAVIDDLIISEHADLAGEYAAYYEKETAALRTKRNVIANVIGSAIYLIVLISGYLFVSFTTKAWGMTWALIVDGILLWVAYLLSLGVKKLTSLKRIFHIFARILLAIMVMVLTVAVFLLVVAVTDLPRSWLIVIAGLVLDGIFGSVTKSRIAIITWLLYIPVIATFLFIIIGALHIIAWRIAWIIIPLSLVIDLMIILLAIAKNQAHKTEVEDIWNEN